MIGEPSNNRHYAFLGLLLLSLVLGAILFWPFLKVLILSIAFTVVFYPVHAWFLRRVTRGNKWFAALFTIIIFLIIVGGPLLLISFYMFDQAQTTYLALSDGTTPSRAIDTINNLAERYLPWASFDVGDYVAAIANSITSSLGDIAKFVLSTIFSLLIFILAMFYFLEDGSRWRKTVTKAIPISDESASKIIARLSRAIEGVVKGYLLVGAIQGILLGIGLWIFNVPNPAIWGFLAGIASLVPTVGTALVSIPAIIFLLSTGETGSAIGLALWSSVLVGLVDNLLTPVVVGRRIDIHPLFILFAVLGGLALLGPAGILIGPLIISFIYALISVYSSEMK